MLEFSTNPGRYEATRTKDTKRNGSSTAFDGRNDAASAMEMKNSIIMAHTNSRE
jgi:hypothetical protein